MGEGLNMFTGAGNLGGDPELRVTQGGAAVLNFSVACSERWVDRDGQPQERTEWVRCVIWGKRAEALSKILTKGSRVTVLGSLRTESYEKDGQKHYATKVYVNTVVLQGGGRDAGGARPGDGRHEGNGSGRTGGGSSRGTSSTGRSTSGGSVGNQGGARAADGYPDEGGAGAGGDSYGDHGDSYEDEIPF